MRGLPPFVHFYNIVAAVTDLEIRLGLVDFLKRPVLSFDVDLVVAEGGDDESVDLLWWGYLGIAYHATSRQQETDQNPLRNVHGVYFYCVCAKVYANIDKFALH